jgi:hypothetical protein
MLAIFLLRNAQLYEEGFIGEANSPQANTLL